MKVYFHFSDLNSCNSYLIVNEKTKESIIVDPTEITEELISQIENKRLKLKAALLTENPYTAYNTGLRTLLNIYSFAVYAADSVIKSPCFRPLKGSGIFQTAGFSIEYFSQADGFKSCCMFKIENAVFTGKIISAGIAEQSSGSAATKKLRKKLFLLDKKAIILPGKGPPSSVQAGLLTEKKLIYLPE